MCEQLPGINVCVQWVPKWWEIVSDMLVETKLSPEPRKDRLHVQDRLQAQYPEQV